MRLMNLLELQERPMRLVVVMAVFLAIGYAVFVHAPGGGIAERSVEVGVASLSPRGEAGGFAIPASCPSYEHNPGECSPPSPSFSGSVGGGSGSGAVTINNGESVTLTWSASSAMSCSGTNFSTGGATSGSTVVAPSSTITYTVLCNYNPGLYTPSTVQSSVGVTVFNPALNINASPTQVRSGNQSTISWSATNVDTCSVTGPSFSATGVSGSQLSGPVTIQSTYTLSCQNAGGSLSQSVIVTLIPAFEEF